jgi:hypothetical protein
MTKYDMTHDHESFDFSISHLHKQHHHLRATIQSRIIVFSELNTIIKTHCDEFTKRCCSSTEKKTQAREAKSNTTCRCSGFMRNPVLKSMTVL